MSEKGDVVSSIKKYVRAANYISAIQIYLQDNFLLERELSFDNIKPRLLGHWGTCPGINFVYANLNYLIKKHNLSMMFVLGPGHGFPALQANLFIEGTLSKFYKEAKHSEKGLGYISKNFSWPYGFPSHSNPGAPGVILEGGELGYSLSTAYGAILDNPNLIVSCLVGDGEAETGAAATAWHLNKFIDPKNNGAVLPILHLNGYKISGPTIFGRMSDKELISLFYGYGYEPFIVEGSNIYENMVDALENCYRIIKSIQSASRSGKKIVSPRFPMIILKTLKGWTGIETLYGEKIEGNCLSHQVVGKDAKKNKVELKAIESWLKSYNFSELFDKNKGFSSDVKSIIPKSESCMGLNRHTYAYKNIKSLKLPDSKKFQEDVSVPGTVGSSSMIRAGYYINDVFKLNKNNFRLFSPDETYSNKLDAVFKSTSRAFVWPIEFWDKNMSSDGRVIEMLSEHSLQGLAQGYVLTGRHCIFASYEAFIEIVSSMTDQYEKFLRVARDIKWRGDIPSFNYILTSSGWRQEHNGFSHQNPKFVSGMLEKTSGLARVFFPPDGNSTLAVLSKCLSSRNQINIIVAGKTLEPRWLSVKQTEKELVDGLMVWDFASDNNPDIVFVGIGDYLTKESLAAVDILKSELPDVRVRFVNVIEISSIGVGDNKKVLVLDKYFTHDKPVIINYHGYPSDMNSVILNQKNNFRFRVHGYTEHGSTTTPFDMHIRNKTSRYHLVLEAFDLLFKTNLITKAKFKLLTSEYNRKIQDHGIYIRRHGVDPLEIELWQWKRNV